MIDWSAMRRVTVIMPTWIGDICMATPALRALRAAIPDDATVTAALRPGLSAVLRGHPAIDAIVTIDPRGLAGPWRAGRVLSATGPDVILILPGSFRAALAAKCSNAKRRVGYARDGRGWLLSDAHTPPDRTSPMSEVDKYCRLIGATTAAAPDLVVTEDDRQEAAAVMPDPPPAWVLLVPGANRTDKRWPADRFAAVANTLHDRYGWTAVITGAPNERILTAEVASSCSGPVLDLAAQEGTLGALKAMAAGAEVVISNDTGPRHIAIAMGTPVVSLFGPTDHRLTLIESVKEQRLLAEPFLPEALMADRCADACSMERIAVGDVLHAIDRWQQQPDSILRAEP